MKFKGGEGMTELYFMNNASYTQMMGFIIRSGGHTVVIDGGMKEDADNLLSHLEKYGAKKVDAWFMTHPHCDHYGAYQKLCEEGRLPEIGAMYESSAPDEYLDSKKGLIAPGEDKEARIYNSLPRPNLHDLKKGEHFEFGDIKIDILRVMNPDITFNFGNNASVVMKVYDKKSVLILGDLGAEAGDEVTAIFRKYVKLRYRLQPYFYDLFRECEETGLPPMRALVLNYEDDPNVHEMNDEFMLGDQMLVAPVVEQGARQRMIYLPKGDWYDFWTGEKQEGGRYFVREAPLDLCPIYVKAGTILPLYPEQRYTDELADPELTLRCYPGEGVYEHYRDNGRDFTYRDGAYTLYRFTLSNAHLTTTLLHDNYKPYTKINVEYV